MHLFLDFNFLFKDMKWIEEKQALFRRNQELVEKVQPPHPVCLRGPLLSPKDRNPHLPTCCPGLGNHLGSTSAIRPCVDSPWREGSGRGAWASQLSLQCQQLSGEPGLASGGLQDASCFLFYRLNKWRQKRLG